MNSILERQGPSYVNSSCTKNGANRILKMEDSKRKIVTIVLKSDGNLVIDSHILFDLKKKVLL